MPIIELFPFGGTKYINNQIEIQVAQVVILKKRPNAIIPCDPKIMDDDDYIREKVIRHVGCVPIYWTLIKPMDKAMPVCNTSSQMKELYNLTNNIETTLNMYTSPCQDMTIVTGMQIGQGLTTNHIDLKINYLSKFFQKITNQRDFNFESFFSGVGGFMGIFLGYSMLQIPDIFISF